MAAISDSTVAPHTVGVNGIFLGIAYSLLSTACVLHNKYLLSTLLPHANLLLIAQDAFTIMLVLLLCSPLISWLPTPLAERRVRLIATISPGDCMVGTCNTIGVITGVWCLQHLSVPMFSSIKRCNIIVMWIIEALVAPTATTWPTFKALLVLIMGTVLMTYYDLQFSAAGYLFGVVSCLFQSMSLEMGKRYVHRGKDLWSMLFINSIISLVVQLLCLTIAGQLPVLQSVCSFLIHGRSKTDPAPLFLTTFFLDATVDVTLATPSRLMMHLCLNAALIALMNYVIFLNCSVNSPLAHTVTGNVKGIVTVAAGAILFHVPLNSMALLGIVAGFIGAFWFSWVKLKHKSGPPHEAKIQIGEEDEDADGEFSEKTIDEKENEMDELLPIPPRANA